MPPADLLLALLTLAAAGAAALVTANLATARRGMLRRREELVAEVNRRRQAYAERVAADMAAFEAEFCDVELDFLPPNFSQPPVRSAA